MNESEVQNDDGGAFETTDCEFQDASGATKEQDHSVSTATTRRKRSSSPCNHSSGSRNSRISAIVEDQATDQLEKCGRWLASIPRDDITVLRHTVEFKDFLEAFKGLGDAHLRVVVNGNSNQTTGVSAMEIKQEDGEQYHPRGPSLAFDGSTDESAKQNGWTSTSDDDGKKCRRHASFRNGYITAGTADHNVQHDDFTNAENLQNGVILDKVSSQTSTTSSQHRRSPKQRQMVTDLSHRRNGGMRYSYGPNNGSHFLRFTDDILFRVLEFLQCRCLIQTSLTCSRFYRLVIRSATQRTYDIAAARQLGNVMQLLRAREQIYHVDSEGVEQADDDAEKDNSIDIDIDADDDGNNDSDAMMDYGNTPEARYSGPGIYFNVPVPTLLPGRRVLVTNAGDPEYNGVYYCTDCNGNGFVFAKPRFSSHRRIRHQHQQLEGMVFDEESNPLRQNRVVGVIARAGRLPLVNPIDHDDEDDDEDNNGRDRMQARHVRLRRQRQATAPSNPRRSNQGAEESFQSKLPLRCIIAKAYSRENILWYMSKEIDEMESSVEQRGDGVVVAATTNAAAAATSARSGTAKRRRKRIFSFYAPQMLAGNTPPELSVYPSQTSALLHQHNEWRTLRTTVGMDVPILEVLD